MAEVGIPSDGGVIPSDGGVIPSHSGVIPSIREGSPLT